MPFFTASATSSLRIVMWDLVQMHSTQSSTAAARGKEDTPPPLPAIQTLVELRAPCFAELPALTFVEDHRQLDPSAVLARGDLGVLEAGHGYRAAVVGGDDALQVARGRHRDALQGGKVG